MKVSADVDDEELVDFLDDVDNKAETLREALRLYRLQNEAVEDERLTGAQRAAYQWLREQAGVGGTIRLEVARTVLAQTLSRDKVLIKHTVLKPLERLGYIEVTPAVEIVRLRVLPPQNDDPDPSAQLEVDGPEDAGERLDSLVAAAEEVSQSAD